MEPLNGTWFSVWCRGYRKVDLLPPYSQAWAHVDAHLWDRFDYSFITKDK